MAKTKSKIPFTVCDSCVEMHSIIKDEDHGFERYMEFSKKNDPSWNNVSIEEFQIAFNEFKCEFPQFDSKCPFNFKPNLKMALRRKYRMRCFCGEEFQCPADLIRYKGRAYCGNCISDEMSPMDDYCPTAEDDQREVNQYLINRYGEC